MWKIGIILLPFLFLNCSDPVSDDNNSSESMVYYDTSGVLGEPETTSISLIWTVYLATPVTEDDSFIVQVFVRESDVRPWFTPLLWQFGPIGQILIYDEYGSIKQGYLYKISIIYFKSSDK